MTVTIRTTGPLFTGGAERLEEAVNRGLLDIAVAGGVKVQEQLYSGHGRVTGFLRSRVAGNTIGNLHIQIDAGEKRFGKNVIYANWVEGISQRNRTSTFKGYFMFKNVYDWLKRQPKEVDDMLKNAIKEAFE
tara:strand:+ start:1771 stop:2166 length:396 start_codon:yes stop_codon:yes gene_type:complete